MIILAIIGIALISVGLSLWSLQTMQKGLKTRETKAALKKGRVIFHSSNAGSSSKS